MFSFLTPGFFDALIWLAIVTGVIVAALRVIRDFRRGSRWIESGPSEPTAADNRAEKRDDTNRSDKA